MLNNYLESNEYEAANGMDTTSALSSMKPGFARIAFNCNLGLVSGWIKRSGYTKVNSGGAWGSLSVTAGTEFRKSDGSLITVLFGKSTGGTSGKLGFLAAGSSSAPTDIVSSLSDAYRPAFAQFRGRLFMYNGTDNGVWYDGSSYHQIGITTPASAPTGSGSGSGSLTAGSYIVAITYYNSTTKAESSPSALSASITVTANQTIPLTIAAGSSTTADYIRIWRTVANGNQLFLDGTVAIASTSYTCTIADSALGRPLEMDNSRLAVVTSDKGKFPVVAQSRVFLCTGRNEIRYSALGYDGPMPESFQAKAVVDTSGTFGDGDSIVGLGNIGDLVVVVKRRSIGILQPLDLPSYNSEVDTQGYFYKEISNSVGGVSHWAGGEVQGLYVFAGRDMIWATDGQQIIPISPSMQATVRALGWSSSQVENVSFGVDAKYRRVYFQVYADSDDTTPKYTLVGDYQQHPTFRWTMYVPGTNETTHPGLKAGCFFPVTNSTDGSPDMWMGNISGNGYVYKMNTGTSDDSTAIYYQVTTRPQDLAQPNQLKLFKVFRGQVAGDGTDYDITMAPLYDLGVAEGTEISQSLAGGDATFDLSLFDQATFPSDESILVRYDSHRKARYMQLVFKQYSADAPVTIFGWSSSGSAFSN